MYPLLAGLVLPQLLIAPESVTGLARQLDASGQGQRLSCAIRPLPPQLGFSFVHWSGFGLTVPVKQFAGGATDLGVLIEITPTQNPPPAGGAKAIYLGERFRIPAPEPGQKIPKDAQIQYMGGYFLGPGHYRVRMIARTAGGQACGKDWGVRVKAGQEPLALEPNQIVPVGGQRWKGLPQSEPKRRVTVVMEASPLFPRRNMVRISSFDRSALLTSLTSILDSAGFTHATVVAADSMNRKLIFSAPEFGPRELRRLGRALGEINVGAVSLKTLQGPGPAEFLESVLDAVDGNIRESEAVVFLGPAWSWNGRLTPRLREIGAAFPAMHHLALTRFPFDDNLLARFVKAGNGSARQVYTPADLAKAIEKIGRARSTPSGE
jgi:hypothetical protein